MSAKIYYHWALPIIGFVMALNSAMPTASATELRLAANCNIIPNTGLTGLTSNNYYFSSELHQQLAVDPTDLENCGWLQCFLNDVSGTAYANATLVIDQQCRLWTPIRIPHRYTLAGVGIAGQGALIFEDLPANTSAIHFGRPGANSHITVRDLTITHDGPAQNVNGLDLSDSQIVSIENIWLQNFDTGIYAENSIYVSIDKSNISLNSVNLELGDNTSSWRIRDSLMSRATEWSIDITSDTSQEHLISGVRFECNGHGTTALTGAECHNSLVDHGGGAVRNAGAGVQFTHNRFEGNNADGNADVGVNADRDIVILPSAKFTRVLSNNIGGLISDDGVHTECAHNVRFSELFELSPNTGC